MRALYSLIASILIVTACSTIQPKLAPEYDGVDPKLQSYVDEFLALSKLNHVTFKHSVTVGFKRLSGSIVGMCTHGGLWNEIDIDPSFWNYSTNLEKTALIYHELTHCYCNRGHDHGKGEEYGTLDQMVKEVDLWHGGEVPGRYPKDFCPTTLMYPRVLDNECMQMHYNDYVKEMFDRCSPW
jgi:hypothetical protein